MQCPGEHLIGNRGRRITRTGALLAASDVLAQQQPELAVGVAQQELEARLRDGPLLCARSMCVMKRLLSLRHSTSHTDPLRAISLRNGPADP